MLDSKSCRYSWKWEGQLCCKRSPFSLCHCTEISSFWTTTTHNKADSEKWKKSWTTVPAINLSQLIPPLVFISTLDLYHIMMLWSSTDFASATPDWLIVICCQALINRTVQLVIAHKQSSTFWLNVLHWLALVTNILLLLQWRTFFGNVAAWNITRFIKETNFYSTE